jgi:hypothetical protein
MKIRSINSGASSEGIIAFNTLPALNGRVYGHFKEITAHDGIFDRIQFKFEGEKLYVMEGRFSRELKEAIDRVLTEAEKAVQLEDQAAREEQTRKLKAIQAVGEDLGIPVE